MNAAGTFSASGGGASPCLGKQFRQHYDSLAPTKASPRPSPQHCSVAWNQQAQQSHMTPYSTTLRHI